MLYVTQFDTDVTKSFTQVAFHNIRSLQDKNVNFEIVPLNNMVNWDIAPSWIRESSKDYFAKARSDNQSALVHLLPQDLFSVPYKGKDSSIAVTAFETTMLAKWVADAVNTNYKGMIVPSEFNKTALQNSGVTIPIEVVYHPLLPEYVSEDTRPIKISEGDYVFGYVGNWNARKNPQCVLDTYIKTFPENGKTKLLIKTFNAGDLEGYIRRTYGEMREDVWIYDESWNDNQMLWAYNTIDCYVSAHRGEGFGLALAQSAALGKPVIYTDFSAPTEWLSSEKGHFPVNCDEVYVDKESLTAASHQSTHCSSLKWADIDIDHLAETMRSVVQKDIRQGFKGDDLRNFQQRLTWDRIGQDLIDAYARIMGRSLDRIPKD